MSEMNKQILSDEELDTIVGGAARKIYGNGTRQLVAYTVKERDNLSKIAKEHNTTVTKIVNRNSIIKNRNLIRPGWVLKIMANDR